MGYAEVGFHGSRDIPTPNLDALAKGGIRFTDAYAIAKNARTMRQRVHHA